MPRKVSVIFLLLAVEASAAQLEIVVEVLQPPRSAG
jgi:hypothetical protein